MDNFTIEDTIRDAVLELKEITNTPTLEAEILICFALGITREKLYTCKKINLTKSQRNNFLVSLASRLTGKPIAYIINRKDFWSLSLYVDENVLIPRPETEVIVEAILDRLDKHNYKKVLDLGTGSGAIAISLASERDDLQVIGSDCSQKAVNIAKENAKYHGIEEMEFICGNWFEPFQNMRFDVIVSNPPYIRSDDPHFDGDIRFEPIGALDGGETGQDCLQEIIQKSPGFLKKSGMLVVEHGYDQAQTLVKLFKLAGFNRIEVLLDYAGLERATLGYLG